MADTTPVYARIDTNLKDQSEAILKRLGLSLSSFISMMLSQVVLNDGLPFDIRIPEKPIAAGTLTKEELEKELEKGVESSESEKTYTSEEVEEIMKDKYNF